MSDSAAPVTLRRLAARDFRNLRRVNLSLAYEGAVVIGDNGHGKTNLLEAIYYLQLLRSVRGARDQDLVRFGEAGFHLSAEALVGREREITVGFERATRRKRVRLDGADAPRLSDALGAVPSVMVSPRDVALVAGPPSERRRYLDVVLALTSRRYLAALQGYRGALVRRNAALRDVARTGAPDARIAVWEPPLAQYGAVLWNERAAWVALAAVRFPELCAAIGERAPARLRYVAARPADGDVARELAAALAAGRPTDVRRGLTHAGPHRDDLELALMDPDGSARDLRNFGSAGQQRTAAIALRMLEAETLRDRVGHQPILLLDDPFAELDARRAARILDLLAHEGMGQTVLAVPRTGDIPRELTRLPRLRIAEGSLVGALD